MTLEDSPLEAAISAMEQGDTPRALHAGRAWSAESARRRSVPALPDALRQAFLALLRRRGFFVATPADLARSLEEIRGVGDGFDLYDLAAALADLDTLAADCLRSVPRRLFPELRRFASRCPCGRHPSNDP